MGETQFHPPVGESVEQADTLQRIAANVVHERWRQIAKWGVQHHPDGTHATYEREANQWKSDNDADVELGCLTWMGILAEEFWEAMAETEPDKLRAELIQVAGVALAWCEDIDSREAQ